MGEGWAGGLELASLFFSALAVFLVVPAVATTTLDVSFSSSDIIRHPNNRGPVLRGNMGYCVPFTAPVLLNWLVLSSFHSWLAGSSAFSLTSQLPCQVSRRLQKTLE